MAEKNKQTAVVVIPTYNEAGTIGRMIEHLFTKTFPEIDNWEMKLLVVDAQSPDGTAEIVKEKEDKYDNIEVFVEKKKEGIGAAYVKGFRYAMDKMDADAVIEFDGDFQHPPDRIPVMLKEIEKGYDYVLGSRKVKGGSNPKGWGFKRIFFSEAGGLVARFVLFFPSKMFFRITDPTTGLKASRVKGFVDQMEMDNLYSRQFAYKLEFLYKMVKLGAKVKEIPLQFQLREAGESKLTSDTAKDSFRTLILLRLNDPQTQSFIKFGVVGFVGYLVNAFGIWLLPKFKMAEWAVWLLATEMAIISNYTWNNLWTFKAKQFTSFGMIIKKFFQFNLTSAGALIIQTVVGTVLTSLFGTQYRQVYLPIIIVFLVLPYNWIMYNKVIWKKKQKGVAV